VHTGGFGDPNGVHAAANSALSRLAQVGAFDMPAGSGNGGGSGKARVVAMAGFGDGGSGGGGNGPGGTGHGAVRASGFGDYRADAPAKVQAVAAVSPAQTPVEILSKPRPVYTPEARAKGLEGEVELEVVFCGNGSIRVNRVVRGLGLGLDESARAAAAQIRFRPGTRAGVPVDMTGIVHIVFELS
jgi:TonB family protein